MRPSGLVTLIGCAALLACERPASSEPAPLVFERSIPLAGVSGRIDHLAIDLKRNRLFVAELGNGSVDALDLERRTPSLRIPGLSEPQGIAYLARTDEIAVACGGDGTVRFYRGSDLVPAGVLKVGDDADNLHVNPSGDRLVVGYGTGGLAIIDPSARRIVARLALPGHPEGFSLDGDSVLVNVPDRNAIILGDLASTRILARWEARHGSNYPLALDASGRTAAIAYRSPARLETRIASKGETLTDSAACGDADDVFFDGERNRLYLICGSGAVAVFHDTGNGYRPAGLIETSAGARTGLFVAEQDRLFVAAPSRGGRQAEIQVYRATP